MPVEAIQMLAILTAGGLLEGLSARLRWCGLRGLRSGRTVVVCVGAALRSAGIVAVLALLARERWEHWLAGLAGVVLVRGWLVWRVCGGVRPAAAAES